MALIGYTDGLCSYKNTILKSNIIKGKDNVADYSTRVDWENESLKWDSICFWK